MSKKDSNYTQNNHEWFIINGEWLKDWKQFVHNKRSSNAYGARKSTKRDVGILDPGPVTNYLLLDSDNKPLENLLKGKHYRGVNRAVWQQLYNTYGGGPVLRRNELNIYSEEYKEPENYEDFEDYEDPEIDNTAIKNYFRSQVEDEDSQPIVSNELNNSDRPVSHLIMSKHSSHSVNKRSAEPSLESKMRRIKTTKLEPNVRDDKKVSSIPRRNLFKKRFKDTEEPGVKSPMQSNVKRTQYKSLLEKGYGSTELSNRYLNTSNHKEQSDKEIQGTFDLCF